MNSENNVEEKGKINPIDIVNASMTKRRRAEFRFQLFGKVAIGLALFFLVSLFGDIIYKGHSAFQQTYIGIDVNFDRDMIGLGGEVGSEESSETSSEAAKEILATADYAALIKASLRHEFPEVKKRKEKRKLYSIVSSGAQFLLLDMVVANPKLVGTTLRVWLPASDDVDMLMKGYIDRDSAESERRVDDQQIVWVEQLESQDRVDKRFNVLFFTSGDSRNPELAGILGAVMGSIFTLIVTLSLSFPIGVATAVYLEEFAPTNKWTDFIEVNINNLAAVPSIVFGLLGLAVFINFFELPRSAPVVGGLVLTLMTLPTIIISSRAALKSVPAAIREAALGVGGSKLQAITSHVLPLALPGMLTGTIIGMAQALGETAPLLMIGMVAFIVDVPGGFTDPATALPVQIFLWADSPERAFVEKTSGAIMVLLTFLILMNAIAVTLRKRLERRW